MVPLMNEVEAVEQVECSRNISLLLLDAVMRVAKLKKVCRLPNISVEHTPPCTAIVHHYRMADQLSSEKVAISAPNIHLMNGITASNFKAEKLRILSHIPGALRRPPSDNDLNIFSIAPRTISFKESELCAIKTDVPGVSDTFLMLNVLSGDECNQLISVAETIGYCHDAVEGIDNIVLFADNSLLSPIFERCRHLLPQKGLMGINSRFRFFRYSKGAVYRPHIGKILCFVVPSFADYN